MMIANPKKQKQDEIKSDKKKQQTTVVQVQFCTNCDAHLFTVRHQQHKYFSHFDTIRKKLQEQKMIVKKRPVPQNLYKKSPYCPSNVYYKVQTNQVVYFPEIGSFQVYFQSKKIFSKLETLKWPTPQGIAAGIQKIIQEGETKNEVTPDPQGLDRSAEQLSSAKKQLLLQPQYKRQQFRIKSKQTDGHLSFRYSIDRRNLFRKPDHNYLNRKSMTARNQSVSESTTRTNRTAILHKRNVNQEEVLPITAVPDKKQLTDEAVLQMYRKHPLKNSSGETEKTQPHPNLPQIPKKTRKNPGQGNIYLQPIFPKSNINLQNYTRQKQIMANKIHEQRKSYEASKQFKKQIEDKPTLLMKAKFNENCNELLKTKEDRKELTNIKEATEENQIKNKEIQVAYGERKVYKEQLKIEQSHEQKQLQKLSHIAHVTGRPEKQESKEHVLVAQETPEPVIDHISHKETPNEQATHPTYQCKQQTNLPILQKHPESTENKVQKGKRQNHQQVSQTERPQPEQNEKNQQTKKEKAQQEAYEAEFEEQQAKRQIEAQNVGKVQVKKQEEPPKEAVLHDTPAQTNKQEKQQQYEDEQFDKEQPETKQGQNNKVNTADMVEPINQKPEFQQQQA